MHRSVSALAVLLGVACSSTTRYSPPDGGNGGAGGGSAGTLSGGGGSPSGGADGGTAVAGAGGGAEGGAGGSAEGGAGGSAALGGSAGEGGAASTWCDTQAMPVGVAASDYSCVDFDEGLPPTDVWSPTVSATGTLDVTTDSAASLPQSLLVSESPPNALTRTVLAWTATGADSISSVSVAVKISPASFAGVSPPWTGSYSLICIENATSRVCLNYTRGQTLDVNPYTGYYLSYLAFGGAAVRQDCPISPALDPNVWTEVQLVASSSTNELRFNNISVGSCGTLDTASTATVRVGLDKPSGTVSSWRVGYDDLVVAVTR